MLRALFRSSAFRLIALIGGCFLVFLILAGSVAFHFIRQELDARQQAQLEQTFMIIAQSYGEDDLTDLMDSVRSNATANPGLDRVFLLRNDVGKVLAGNISDGPTAPGSFTMTAADLGLPEDRDSYRVFSDRIGPYALLVGASFEETEAIASIVLTSLGWTGGLFVLLVLGAGAFIALRARRRLDGIVQTMARIGRGELSARIPVGKARDDLDDLSLQVNQALERLAGLVEGMRQVSVDIAHDLKTPLNRLSFTVESAIEDDEHGRPVAQLLAQAQDESRQINTTFDALLRIAQIESGARRARFKTVELGEVLETLADAYAGVAEENGQVLTLIVDQALPSIVGDKDLLTQLFANLLENCIRHTPAATRIELRAQVRNGYLAIGVSDNGPGIPVEERDNVFQRLYRLDKSRTTPGSGLGLSLVKAIAELHHATLTVADNAPGLSLMLTFSID